MEPKGMLLDAGDSVLAVIDVQDKFLARLEGVDAERVVTHCEWLMKVANWLSIPTLVTAEEISVMGHSTQKLLDCMPKGVWAGWSGGYFGRSGIHRAKNRSVNWA